MALIGAHLTKEIKRLEHKIDQKPSFVTLLNQIKAVDKKVDDKTGPLMEMQSKLRQLDTVVEQASQLRNQTMPI